MSFTYHRIVLLFCIGILLSTSVGYGLSNPSPQQTSVLTSQQDGSLSGYVTDILMNPLSGALIRVSFHDTYVENYSNSEGYYHVSNIPLCYCIKNATCSKLGYHTQWVLLSISGNTTYDFILTAVNETCYPVFNGTQGNNGWFISCVNISFVTNGDVDSVFYKLDSGMWTQYTTTFEVCQNGLRILYWYWTVQGEESETLLVNLKIDRDSPSLQVSWEWIHFFFTGKIIAEAFDETSSIERVEFYIDNDFFYVAYDIPYEVTINFFQLPNLYPYDVKVIAFDLAGNQANATLTVSMTTQYSPVPFLSFLLRIFSFIQENHIINL